MKRLTITLFLLLVTLAIAASCARVEKEKKTQGLEAATNGYGKAIRWAYYETAYGYLHPSLRKDEELPAELENVRVTSYEVVQPPVIKDKDQTRAEQMVRIEYVLRDRQVMRKLSDRQDWRFDMETEAWWLHSQLPRFKVAPHEGRR